MEPKSKVTVIRRSILTRKKYRGQGAVEFAIVSVLLFLLLLGIIEMAWMLFTYSVVSNAAQEGIHYGIMRPNDVMDASQATAVAALGTQVPDSLIVPDGDCNVVEKARDKAIGLDRSQMDVKVWYDYGDSTPVVVRSDADAANVIQPGNRIVVETSYKYHFLMSLLGSFAPNGIDIKIRSARTILNNGDSSLPCEVNTTPGPSQTPITPVIPATATPVPGRLVIAHLQAWKRTGSQQPLDLEMQITDDAGVPVSDTTIVAIVKRYGIPVGLPVLMPATDSQGISSLCEIGDYDGLTGANGEVTVDVTVLKLPMLPSSGSVIVDQGRLTGCFDPTATPTVTRTRTPTISPTPSNTPIIKLPTLPPIFPTNTPQPTSAATATATTIVQRLVITRLEAWKPSGNNKPMDIRVDVTDDQGRPVQGVIVIVAITNNGLPELPLAIMPNTNSSGVSSQCTVGYYDGNSGGGGSGVVVAVTVVKLPYLPAAGTVSTGDGRLSGCH